MNHYLLLYLYISNHAWIDWEYKSYNGKMILKIGVGVHVIVILVAVSILTNHVGGDNDDAGGRQGWLQ